MRRSATAVRGDQHGGNGGRHGRGGDRRGRLGVRGCGVRRRRAGRAPTEEIHGFAAASERGRYTPRAGGRERGRPWLWGMAARCRQAPGASAPPPSSIPWRNHPRQLCPRGVQAARHAFPGGDHRPSAPLAIDAAAAAARAAVPHARAAWAAAWEALSASARYADSAARAAAWEAL